MAVSQMVHLGYSANKVLEEVEKCEVRCANCHIRKTARDFNYYSHVINQETSDKVAKE